jgi:AraC family transcriptional activator of mtrCDE
MTAGRNKMTEQIKKRIASSGRVTNGNDGLTGLAPLLRVRPEFQEFCRFGGAWNSPHDVAPAGWAHFHIVTRGECVIDGPSHSAIRLQKGDILLLPHGNAHILRARSGAGQAGMPIATEFRNAILRKTSLGVKVTTEMICGQLHFEEASENLLIAALPDVIVLHTGKQSLMDRIRALMFCIRDELNGNDAGAVAIATDLASAMFMMMLRRHLAGHPPVEGLLALLGQRAPAKAVIAMPGDPSYQWTLDELAARALVSRATLIRLFGRISGVAPLTFLTELRLALARRRLAMTRDPISRIAADIGYQSEAALSRAFRRRFGVRPGKFRIDCAHKKQADTRHSYAHQRNVDFCATSHLRHAAHKV